MKIYNVVWLAIVLTIVFSPISLFFGVGITEVLTVVVAEVIFLTALGVLRNGE